MESVVTPNATLAAAYRGRTVLVTGHTGFKGSWLSLWLTRLGAEVVGLSDCIPTQPNHFEALALDLDHVVADVADHETVTAVITKKRPEIVFHLAAQSLVRRAYADPIGTYRTNVLGTLSVLEACRAGDIVRAVVSATTDKVYRNREWEWGYREDDELGGSDPYSASKSCVELLTRSYCESFLRDGRILVANVRAGNVVGGGDWAEDRLLPDIFRAVYRGESVHIRNPLSTRPWQHVLDPLAGYLMIGARLLQGDRSVAEAWNFGPLAKTNTTVKDILALMQQRLPKLSATIAPDNAGRHESGLLELDSSKAAARLGWKPLWEGEMIERTIEWYQAFYETGRLLSEAQVDAYSSALDRQG